ncbi:Multidrug transporter EmrE [Paenibacillus aquistagni]|uniref:Multidrug transporter EmrE n=1 Tax=Paenibacillus aquistagni TaxID=1852522 RepID=A0A1X7KZ56_9BACL|nr:Multidrug transporter EmrE [Paenibacillus aquistagni]
MQLNRNYLYLILSIFFQSFSFVFTKFAAVEVEQGSFFALLLNRYYLTALLCLVLQSIFWQLTLRKIDLSVAYPLTAINNLLILIFSYFIFNEQVSLSNIIGVSIIMIGIVVQSRKSENA